MTSTSRFGTSKRESHDASDFYARFPAPKLLDDTNVVDAGDVKDSVVHGDSRDLSMIPDNSIALVVTSPPYFAGKEYEAVMGEGHVPASYVEYPNIKEGADFYPKLSDNFFVGNSFPACKIGFTADEIMGKSEANQ